MAKTRGRAALALLKKKFGLSPKPSKYRNQRVKTEDGTFDSKAEVKRWAELKLLEKAGDICDLRRQVPFPLHFDTQEIGKYVADFVYVREGIKIVEDVKGHRTQLFIWKQRHLKAEYGISITEIQA